MKKIITETGMYKGKPAIFINGTAVPPQYYALTDCPGGNKSYETIPAKCIRQFSDMGFRLFQADVWLEDMLTPDGGFDIDFARRQIAGFSSICPDAAVMLRLHLNPPSWWLNSNPDECTRFLDCDILPIPRKPAHERYLEFDTQNYYRVSYASEKWLEYSSELLSRFLTLIKTVPEWDNLSSIQIANGIFGENHYWGFTKHEPDVSAPMLKYFRGYLAEKYGSSENLRRAWNNSQVSLETAQLPGLERCSVSSGILRDPQKERSVIDYYEAQHRCVAQSIMRFCGIIKRQAPELMTGAFYGYYLSLFGRQAAGGHLCEDLILNCPDVDFLSAPQAYGKASRELGGPGLSRGLIESVTLHGKVWLSEMDQPSHFGTLLGGMITYNKEDSIQNNRKCVLEPFIRGGGLWYYDFGKYYGAGWWDDDDYLADISKLKNLFDMYFEKERVNQADVLLVLDTKTFFYTANSSSADPITDEMMNLTVIGSYKSGAAVSTVYLSDIEKVDLSDYKCVFFVNCFCADDEKVAYIRDHVMKDGRSAVFAGPFAALDTQTLDLSRSGRSIGISLRPTEKQLIPKVEYTDGYESEGEDLRMYLSEDKRKYGKAAFLIPDGENASIIGRFEDGENAACLAEKDGGKVFYFSLLPSSPSTLKQLFRSCGCHIYSESCDSLLVGQGLVELHAGDDKAKRITLKNGQSLDFDVRLGQTVLFDGETGEKLL